MDRISSRLFGVRAALIRCGIACVFTAGVVGWAAEGGDSAAAVVDARNGGAEKESEIERGVYLAGSAGPWLMFNAPAASGSTRPFSVGQVGTIDVGYDFNSRFAIALTAGATGNRAGADYLGLGQSGASGDFFGLMIGGHVKGSVLGFSDAQGVVRTWTYVRAGAQYVTFFPSALLPTREVMAYGGVGIEYFTRLRHVSIGLEVLGGYYVASRSWALGVTPTIRYAL